LYGFKNSFGAQKPHNSLKILTFVWFQKIQVGAQKPYNSLVKLTFAWYPKKILDVI
jgi:hypothetical protein